MYVNRETGLAPESPSDHKQQRRPSVRPGQGAGSQWWLVRRRQRSGVTYQNTVDDVQRQASQRRNSSGPYSKKRPRRDTITRGGDTSTTSVRKLLRRTRLLSSRRRLPSTAVQYLFRPPTLADTHVSAATHTDGSSSARPAQQLVTLHRTQRSDNFNVDYGGYCRSPREQLSYSSSVSITLCLGSH